MLSLLFGLALLPMLTGWGAVSLSLVLTCLLSVTIMNSSFGESFNMMFSSSGLSVFMILLSSALCLLSVISTPSIKSRSYLSCLCVLLSFLVLAFSSSNIIGFYVWFEASLIPTLILIVCWGYQPERLQAGTYMMLYTVGASLPLLVAIIWRSVECSSMGCELMKIFDTGLTGPVLIFIYAAFLVKLPMYGSHLWLPKAHVEAPLAGSMILAGILLKLGGYGIYKMNTCFSLTQMSGVGFTFVCVSVWGGLLAFLMCLRQVDIKAYVAYSSVGHMGLVSAGFILDRSWGFSSAMITMVAHGFASSALFCLAFFTYEKSHSRSMPYMKGVLKLFPVLSLWWFLYCCINMAAPPSINLMGEMFAIPAVWFVYWGLAVTLAIMVFFSAGYNMLLYTSVNHGDSSSYLTSGSSVGSHELLSLVAHFLPLLIIFKASTFMS